jgi:hypothetical protein
LLDAKTDPEEPTKSTQAFATPGWYCVLPGVTKTVVLLAASISACDAAVVLPPKGAPEAVW